MSMVTSRSVQVVQVRVSGKLADGQYVVSTNISLFHVFDRAQRLCRKFS